MTNFFKLQHIDVKHDENGDKAHLRLQSHWTKTTPPELLLRRPLGGLVACTDRKDIDYLLAKIVSLLKCLPREIRGRFILDKLTQPQRLEIEAFMHSKKPSRVEELAGAQLDALLNIRRKPPKRSASENMESVPSQGHGAHKKRQMGEAARNKATSMDNKTDTRSDLQSYPQSVLRFSSATRSRRDFPRGAAGISGIVQKKSGGPFYHAQVGFGLLTLVSQWRRLLAEAENDLSVLLSIKRSDGVESSSFDVQDLQRQEAFQAAILKAIKEQDSSQERIRIRIHITMSTRYTAHLIGRCLRSPSYDAIHEFDAAMKAWCLFRAACGGPCISGGRGTAYCAPPRGSESAALWNQIRNAYLTTWAKRSSEVGNRESRLDLLAASYQGCREREWEFQECRLMAMEEKRQLRADRRRATEEAQKNRAALHKERQLRKEEQRCMSQEDKYSHWRRNRECQLELPYGLNKANCGGQPVLQQLGALVSS